MSDTAARNIKAKPEKSKEKKPQSNSGSKNLEATKVSKKVDPEKSSKSKKRKLSTEAASQSDSTEENDQSIWDVPDRSPEAPPTQASPEQRPNKHRRTSAGKEVAKELETSKPSALFKPREGREWTLSLAIPGSVIANVKKPDFKSALAGRIARAAAVFCVDEIIVFDDDPTKIPDYVEARYKEGKKSKQEVLESIEEYDEPWQNPDQFLFHVLSYAECPPYLRADKLNPAAALFPTHQNLQWASQLPSLDMPHHLKSHEWCRFREGVSLGPVNAPNSTPNPKDKGKKKSKVEDPGEEWTYIKCGLPFPIKVPIKIDPYMRVTLKFSNQSQPPHWPNLSLKECEALEVDAVAPTTPREEEGYYWGYTVRRATSLSDVYISCDFPDGYDVSIGTSERGAALSAVLPEAIAPRNRSMEEDVKELPEEFKHLLIVFGGVAGLEPAVASDPEFKSKGLTKETAHMAFDAWVNLVQGQGSRTIRMEEAVEFGLFGLKGYVDSMYQ